MSGDQLDLDDIEARVTWVNGRPLHLGRIDAAETLALVAEVRRLRTERDRLRDAARGHVFDPENYITPLRPQIRALRDAILAGVSR